MFLLLGNCEMFDGGEMKEEKRRMKKLLWDWGQAMERFNWKEEELKKLQNFYEMRKKIWGDAKGGKDGEKNERQYQREVKRLRLEMEGILMEREQMELWMKELTLEERMFLELRFEKGYSFDYIGMKMHRSRATLFRMQDQVLERLILMQEKVETP